MFRLIGYFTGIILYLVLGICKVSGWQYFLSFSIISIITGLLVALFRVLGAYYNGFWRVWWKRFQKWIPPSLMCLSHYAQLPEYEITQVPAQQDENKDANPPTNSKAILWGLLEMLICIVFTVVAPLLSILVFIWYGEAIYFQCQYKKIKQEQKQKKQQEIARCSLRMSLSLNSSVNHEPPKERSSIQTTHASTFPIDPSANKKNTVPTNELNNQYGDLHMENHQILIQNQLDPYVEYKTQQKGQIERNRQDQKSNSLKIWKVEQVRQSGISSQDAQNERQIQKKSQLTVETVVRQLQAKTEVVERPEKRKSIQVGEEIENDEL